jgi:hypothetical protein
VHQIAESADRKLAVAFSQKECWKVLHEMVAEALPEMRAIQRDIAAEN